MARVWARLLVLVLTGLLESAYTPDMRAVVLPPSETPVSAYQRYLQDQNHATQLRIARIQHTLRQKAFTPVSDSLLHEIAIAIHRDAKITGLPHSFYVGLILVENPWLDPTIKNWYGAVGLTQVVTRFHKGAYPECGDNASLYFDVHTQICYGARLYLDLLRRHGGDSIEALWAYNGCSPQRRLANEPCVKYPEWISSYSDQFLEGLD